MRDVYWQWAALTSDFKVGVIKKYIIAVVQIELCENLFDRLLILVGTISWWT